MKQELSAPTKRPTHHPAIEIQVFWKQTPLGVHELTPPCSFWLGEPAEGEEPCDVSMDAQVLGARRVPLVRAGRNGRVELCLLPGAEGSVGLPRTKARPLAEVVGGLKMRELSEPVGARMVVLPHGAVAQMRIGDLSFRIALTEPASKIARRAMGRAAWVLAGCCAVSLAAHSGLGCAAFLSHDSHDTGELTEDQRYLLQYYVDQIAERRMDEAEAEEVAADQADHREGGSGARARGEEGAMGGKRYGVRARSEPLAANAHGAALHDAAEFGMIGLLGSGAGGDPDAPTAPWGRDDALGTPIGLEAIGTMGRGAGRGTGQGFGSGHGRLGLSGIGRGGGGNAGGTTGRPATWVQPLADVPIDPNGRFSTTYRPGRGHLAAFEAAVSRGIVPVAARQLVADVGARYAPDVAVPTGQALGYAIDLERQALGPAGGPLHVRVALQSTARSPAGRPRLSVHLVLDESGSMAGEPIERAKQAAAMLVDRLAPTDEFSLITFADDASARVPVGFVGQRQPQIKTAIASIQSGGGTNIGEALAQAYRQARLRSKSTDAIPVVLLLSDGQPTVGERNSTQLSARALEAFQDGIQTSTFGLGDSYDGNLMSAVASDGAGGYYYLRDSEQIGAAFRAELKQRLDPAATAVELRLRLADGVELLRVYGSRRLGQAASARVRATEVAADRHAEKRFGIEQDRQTDTKGGMRFFIPAFARDDSYALLVKVHVPEGQHERQVGVLEIKYKDRLRGCNVVDERPIEVAYAVSDAASAGTVHPSVARTVQGHRAGEDLLRAAWHLSRGDRSTAVALLEERASLLRRAAEALDEPAFTTDASRFVELLAHVSGQLPGAIREPYALAMVLETAGRAHIR